MFDNLSTFGYGTIFQYGIFPTVLPFADDDYNRLPEEVREAIEKNKDRIQTEDDLRLVIRDGYLKR